MAQDARFEDTPFTDRPLRLRAESVDDLAVISSLVQDSVGLIGEIAWMPRCRRLAFVINRFRWEDCDAAKSTGRPFERVKTAITVEHVLGARARGLDPRDKDTVVSLLALSFEAADDGSGRVSIAFAGDGELALDVECLEVTLTDLTRPWKASCKSPPAHQI